MVVMRYDTAQPGLASLNKRTGEPDPAANVNAELFPMDVFREALELTSGMPYARRGPVKLGAQPPASATDGGAQGEPDAEQDTPDAVATVSSAEYAAIVSAYTSKKGDLSYELINKDFIQFAKSNRFVADMVAQRASVDDIVDHIVMAKLQSITGNSALTTAQTRLIVEMLDEVSPRHVFRELKDEIRKMLGASKV
ncbi:hypothetical protein [Massilia consociata]|uniref:Uncharacterized protein n=1 Tax=Massilia consociata TaxID=760117 RepID=A0ABV6FEG9_9BURK